MTSTAAPAGAKQAPTVANQPFRVGTQNVVTTDGYTQTSTFTTTSAASPLTPYNPTASSFLRGIWILSQGVVTGQSTNSVVFNADGPFAVYSQIQFNDTQGRPILLLDGFELAMANKYGGYHNMGDPVSSAAFYATTGTASTAGSWQFLLYVPLELVQRDAIGSLVNKNQASPFQLMITVAGGSTAYTSSTAGNAVYGAVAPSTNSTTVTTICLEDSWWQPQASDAQGNPLSPAPAANGATQYWLKSSYSMVNGANQVQLSGGLGYSIRNIVFESYGVSTVTRASGDTNWPATTQIIYKGTTLLNISQQFWNDKMARLYGLLGAGYGTGTAALKDATAVPALAGGTNVLNAGIYVLPFCQDFDLRAGSELRRGYLVSAQGDQFQMIATFGAACTMYELVNYVAAPGNNAASLRNVS